MESIETRQSQYAAAVRAHEEAKRYSIECQEKATVARAKLAEADTQVQQALNRLNAAIRGEKSA